MDQYIEITFLPDPEMPLNWLLNAIYTKFHKALYDLNSNDIGVSFPKYNILLGSSLRIHGNQQKLSAFANGSWLGGMNGYCKVSEILAVPDGVQYRTISRRQPTMSLAKLKRLVKRGSIQEDEIKQYQTKMFAKGLDNPYVELISGSNGQKHRRYIEFGEILERPVIGEFDQFGLSKTATVPWF